LPEINFEKYEAVIGLEVHAQMKTRSKAFCSCSTEFNAPPNTNVCPICLAHPGTLPVLNLNLVEYILRLGLATDCSIAGHSIFARKNYFYPDLPKGYQISQYERPICYNGFIKIDENKRIGITRIHMEEDSGKSIHDTRHGETLVDFNRCGVPLIEIVSEPDIRTPEEAYSYLIKLKQLVQYLEICDGNMEEGSLRCDANISVRLKGDTKFNTRTEVKNLNSFRNVSDALSTEMKRQIEIVESHTAVVHQTMTYDARTKKTIPTRSKEEVHDYRYFPEPDLVFVHVSEEWVNRIKKSLPELPAQRRERFIKQYGIPKYNAEILTQEKAIADYFEKVCSYLDTSKSYKMAGNWVMTEILRSLNENKIEVEKFWINEKNLSLLIDMIEQGKISNNIAKDVYSLMLKITDGENPSQNPNFIVKEKNLLQVTNTAEIEEIVLRVIRDNPKETERYRSGDTNLLGFFVGRVMKESKGKANPNIVNDLLVKNLNRNVT
jgi:aspartyl-tRNA(Asn)/glutamyl-tRNA(Gln) amidotransferase subunit B